MTDRTLVLRGAYNLVMGAALGTFLAGSAILSYRRWRGDRRLSPLPGHWLLIFGLAAALADGAAIALHRSMVAVLGESMRSSRVYWLPYRLSRRPTLPGLYHQSVGWGLGALIALAFCWSLRRRLVKTWLGVFITFFMTALVLAGGSIGAAIVFHDPLYWEPMIAWSQNANHIFAGFAILGSVLIVEAALLDCRERAPTDLLHWAGVAAWLAIAFIQLVLFARFMI